MGNPGGTHARDFLGERVRICLDVEAGRAGQHIRNAPGDAVLIVDSVERLHCDRYRVAEQIYVTEIDPTSLVDV